MGKIRLGKKQTAVIGIILIVAIYVTYKVINLIKNPSDTFFIEKGKIYEEENAIGYIIRDEKVVKGENYKNGILQIKAEGEKVAKGEAIFRYYSNKEDNLTKKIEELDTKIDEAMANQSTLPASDLKILENQIEEKLDSIYNVNDLEIIKENKKDINLVLMLLGGLDKQLLELSPIMHVLSVFLFIWLKQSTNLFVQQED